MPDTDRTLLGCLSWFIGLALFIWLAWVVLQTYAPHVFVPSSTVPPPLTPAAQVQIVQGASFSGRYCDETSGCIRIVTTNTRQCIIAQGPKDWGAGNIIMDCIDLPKPQTVEQ